MAIRWKRPFNSVRGTGFSNFPDFSTRGERGGGGKGSIPALTNVLEDTANSIKVDIDNSQLCNMSDQRMMSKI